MARVFVIYLAAGVGSPAMLSAQSASDIATQIDLLGRNVPLNQKVEASQKLVAAGKATIPVLIGALRDQRIYERRDSANRMNLPGNAQAPEPRLVNVPVGDHCRDLLYQIITPVGSPFDGKFKVFSERKLQVDNWDAWWGANKHKSLAAIHAELKPLVDEYWKRHGTTQNVGQAGDPSEWQGGIPIPKGARSAASLTNTKTYDIAATVESLGAFYARHLPGAKPTSSQQGITFATPGGSVSLTPSGHETRIIVRSGPP